MRAKSGCRSARRRRRGWRLTHWIDIIGIGEDGLKGLDEPALTALEQAEVIIGGSRHHDLTLGLSAKRVKWPEPFSEMTETINQYRHSRLAVLVTGDPLWFSAGAKIARAFPPEELRFHPNLSAFQLACSRMRWSLADTETLTVHGRPIQQIIPWFAQNARMAVLTGGSGAPGDIARLLSAHGFAGSEMTVLAALGGPDEQRFAGLAEDWAKNDPKERIPPFHTLCIECRADKGSIPLTRGPGLPDEAFETDGNFTKREVRAVTLSALAPRRHALLWDIGTGCGTIAVEWMRAAADAKAIGVDPVERRLEIARRNALALGAPRLQLVKGIAPDALADLPDPDSVFVGGGLKPEVFEVAMARIRPFGRLVANAVTLESEALLAGLHLSHGGELVRISVARASDLGGPKGWRPLMPVTQWRWNR